MSPLIVPERLQKLPAIELASGTHMDVGDGMCAVEAAAWLAGEKHSDHPDCVCPVVGAYVHRVNDAFSPAWRNRLLLPLVPKLVGSRSTREVELKRAFLAVDVAIRTQLPKQMDVMLREVVATNLRALQPIVDAGTAEAAQTVCRRFAGPTWVETMYAAAAAGGLVAARDLAEVAYNASYVGTWTERWAATPEDRLALVGLIEMMLAIQPEVAS